MHRLMFIPASGPKGTGEYFRSLNIARILAAQRSDLEITFLLNRNSAGADHCPFHKILLPDTPTYSEAEVAAALNSEKPELVIFDATGRSSQVRHAHRMGAKTLFIAQNRRILSRGLGLKRLSSTDEIWIAQPESMLRVSGYNRFKAHLASIPVVHIGPVFPEITKGDMAAARELIPFLNEPFILFNPGGGGHMVDGVPGGKFFEKLACRLRKQLDIPVLLVYGPNYTGEKEACEGVLGFSSLEPEIFNVAIHKARGFVSGGGGALFQAAAYQTPTWAMSLSPDQDFRINELSDTHDFIQRYITFEILLSGLMHMLDDSRKVRKKESGNKKLILDRIDLLLN